MGCSLYKDTTPYIIETVQNMKLAMLQNVLTSKMPKKRRQEPLEECIYESSNTSQTSSIVIKPCPFFGNLDEDFDSRMKNFDRIAKENGWSKGKQSITIPAFFRNRAAEHYESLEEDAKDDYNLQCESLRERFTPKQLQTLLFQLVWMQTEQPTIRKKISIKEHFVQGLKSDLKKMLYFYTTKGRDRFH